MASRLSSMTTRVLSSDSSRTSVISVSSFSLTSSAMRETSSARFTLNGISVTMICSLPPLGVSVWSLARTLTLPRPGLEIILDALHADERAAGREIGALDVLLINCGIVMSGLSICAQMPSMTSVRLCGARLVAMPTAMPVPPLTSRFGNAAGSTTGSMFFSS